MYEHMMTSREASDYLGVDEKKLKELVRKRIIPAYKIGGAYLRFRKDQLDKARSALLHEPAKENLYQTTKTKENRLERVKDFLYFNDFYIMSVVFVILAVVLILTP